MIDAAHLRTLADHVGPERAFLSVYLDAGEPTGFLDARERQIRALLADQPEETEHFERNLEIARDLLRETSVPDEGALALYISWAADLAEVHHLPVPVGSRVWVGDAPYVRPAAELLDEHETFAVAVLDNTHARVFLVTAEDAEIEASVRGDVKNRVKKGGWSQKRYARRREKQIEGYATDIVEALVDLDRDRPFARLVLLGSDEPVRAVTGALPRDLADRLAGSQNVSADATEAELLEAATEVADAGERASEQRLWDEIREQGLGPGLAAFGATNVLDALAAARVDTLLVSRDAAFPGTRCRSCEHVVHGSPQMCQACGSSGVYSVDLVEAMTGLCLRTGADVDYADPFEGLTDIGGVAALLRY